MEEKKKKSSVIDLSSIGSRGERAGAGRRAWEIIQTQFTARLFGPVPTVEPGLLADLSVRTL